MAIVFIRTALALAMAWTQPAQAAPGWLGACWRRLVPGVELAVVGDAVLYRGAPITGESIYPTELVLSNLGLTAQSVVELRGKKVLSLGEGFSGLLPYLREFGVEARAQDVWYKQKVFADNWIGQQMRQYVVENGKHLLAGDSTKRIPLPARSQDLVVSHMLVNNLSLLRGMYVVNQAFHVTRSGGEVRIFGFNPEHAAKIESVLRNVYGEMITFELSEREFRYVTFGNEIARSKLLLHMRVR